MNQCDQYSGCVDVAYAGTQCYYKGGLGEPRRNANVWGAKQVSGCSTPQLKLKLHRKRVSPFRRVKRAGIPVGPDTTYTRNTATATATTTTRTTTVVA
jgi:hypothetical protein